MRRLTMIDEVRSWRGERAGMVGLVPTMGALHAGHLSLVETARRETDRVLVSVFVNPTQFGPREDYARYPRDLGKDEALLERAGADAVFAPSVEAMYPPEAETTVDVGSVAAPLEGERRPGHFRGVATVVLKLLEIATPDRAYFGEKDAQQLEVVRRLVADLDVPVEVRACPIVREPDGLALSSRNAYLSPAERRAAPVLFRALGAAEEAWRQGERRGDALREEMRSTLRGEPLARVDYAAVVHPASFREIEVATGPVRLLLAVHLGETRLIDNLLLEP
jgi:pantoate--beta-alanine ligase